MQEKDFITIINGIEKLDSNLMEMMYGGISDNTSDCTCGSGNSNTGNIETSTNDCTCGLGNSNKIPIPANCSCGSANSNSAHGALGLLQFG